MKKLLLFLFLIVLGVAATALISPNTLGVTTYVDRTPPELSLKLISSPSYGIQIESQEKLSEITSLSVNVTQGNSTSEVSIADYWQGDTTALSLFLPLKNLSTKLNEGQASATISVTDNSFWKNSTSESINFTVDKHSPRLNVLSQQHRMFAGGTELVVYSLQESNLLATGVKLGEETFCGVPLKEAYPDSNAAANIYVSLFAAPLDMEKDNFHPQLFATDQYGNETKLSLHMRFDTKKVPEAHPALSKSFLERKVPPLLEESTLDYPDLFQTSTAEESADDDTWISYFKIVNEKYRATLRNTLRELLTDKERCGAMQIFHEMKRPLEGSLMSGFGEQRFYKFDGNDAGFSVHEGFDLASVRNDNVVATGAGTVLLAEEFGIYGNAVLLDHGLGLSSLYGHLTSLHVNAGDRVEEGQVLGQSGETGLAGGDHLHFELRVGFIPVTPIEWWDKKWFTDNITGKLASFLTSEKSSPETK